MARSSGSNTITFMVALSVVGLLAINSLVIPLLSSEVVEFSVTDKERVVSGSGSSIRSKYLIYTDLETFENTDCWVKGKFDSSDFYGRISEGGRYRAEVVGFRIPFLSSYRNIVSVTALPH